LSAVYYSTLNRSFKGKVVDVVLVEPIYPINLGIIARTIKNFNIGNLVLVNPITDLIERAIVYSARGAEVLNRAEVYLSLNELRTKYDLLVGTTAKSSIKPSLVRDLLTPKDLADIVYRYDRVAIVFGREDIGLKNSELELMDVNVKIPASDLYPTLNLAISVGIVLYELYSSRSTGGQMKAASWNERLLLISTVSSLLKSLGLSEELVEKSQRALQNITARSVSSEKEIMTLQAAFNKATILLKKLRLETHENI